MNLYEIKDKKPGYSFGLKVVIGLLLLRFLLPLSVKLLNKPQSEWFILTFEVFTYFAFCLLIWEERNNLPEYNIQKNTLFVFLFGSVIRTKISSSDTIINIESAFFFLASIYIFLIIRKFKWQNERSYLEDVFWVIGGIFIGVLLSLSFSIPTFLNVKNNCLIEHDNSIQTVLVFLQLIIHELGHAAIPEELLFRGFLWGYLRKNNWQERWILFIQASLFWLAHINLVTSPYSFWITIPVSGIILGLLVLYSRSTSTSIITHTILNAMRPFISNVFPFLCKLQEQLLQQ